MNTAREPKETAGWRKILQRLRGRLEYGLLTQELLDRLSHAGLVIYPYFIVLEPTPAEAESSVDPRCAFHVLGTEHIQEIVGVSEGRVSTKSTLASLARAMCIGVFYDGRLAGYSWAALDEVPIPGGHGPPVLRLGAGEAYLFDMYVASAYRGLRLAGGLRQAMQRELVRRGITRFYSVTLAFNRSSRRFKSRLGAIELELRVYLHGLRGSLPGCDLRLWRREPRLASKHALRVHAIVKVPEHS